MMSTVQKKSARSQSGSVMFRQTLCLALAFLLMLAIPLTVYCEDTGLTSNASDVQTRRLSVDPTGRSEGFSACTIPGAYQTLRDYMRTNGLSHVENEVIPCFETDGESMDVYLACK